MGKQWKQWETISLGSKITADDDWSHQIKRHLLLGRTAMKKQRHYFADKCPCSQSYGFSSSDVWMWDLDYKESWALNNWCFWTVVLEETLESPLDWEIKPTILKEISLKYSLKYWCWSWNSNTLATWCEELTHWKRPWCWERLKAGEGADGGWNGWMASPQFSSVQSLSRVRLCNPMNRSTPGLSVYHHLPVNSGSHSDSRP